MVPGGPRPLTSSPAAGTLGRMDRDEQDLPPELRTDQTPAYDRVDGAPLWARVVALVLIVAVASFFVLSYFV